MPMPYCPRCGKDHPNCLCYRGMNTEEIASAIASGGKEFDTEHGQGALARIMRGNTKGLLPKRRK